MVGPGSKIWSFVIVWIAFLDAPIIQSFFVVVCVAQQFCQTARFQRCKHAAKIDWLTCPEECIARGDLKHVFLDLACEAPLAAGRSAQLSDFGRLPAQAGQIEHPALILFLEELDGEWFLPGLEGGVRGRVFQYFVIRFEAHPMMGDVVPCVVHIDVELRAREELEPRPEVSPRGLCNGPQNTEK